MNLNPVRALKSAYKALDDKVFQGFLPGGNAPFEEGTLVRDLADPLVDIAKDPMGREFASNEAEAARLHATNERLAAQEFSSAEALAAREFNALEAQKARDHSEYLAETEYERKMRSMTAAGLNPVLAAGGWGSGSQVPSSAQAQGVAAHSSPGSSPSAAGSVMAPLQALLLAAQIRDISSASKLKDEQAKDLSLTRDPRVNEMQARADLIAKQIQELQTTIEHKQTLTQEVNKRIEKLEYEISSARSKAEVDAAVAEFQTGVGGAVERWSNAVGLKGRDVSHLIGAIVGFGKFARFFSDGSKVTTKRQPDIIVPEGVREKPFEIYIPQSWK